MLGTRNGICKFRQNFRYIMVQHSSSNSPINCVDLTLQPKFSNAEKEKILTILNGSNSDRLMCLNIAQNKVRNLENYKKRKGPFKSLDELLDVDGLSVKTLEKLCKQIITEAPSPNGKSANNDNKKIKQLLVPQLPPTMVDTLCSSVGIHLAPMGVSWAKITESNNELKSWGYEDFGNLPKKMCPVDTFKLAMHVLNQIPYGDVYVFEGTNGMGLQGQKQPATVTSYTVQLELSSMLVALINTSKGHNKDCQDDSTKYDGLTNCVYFLRPKLPARLFKTLVGNECVSNTATVLQLLGDPLYNSSTLPCTPISVKEELKNDYLAQSSAHKELLGQALTLSVAFTDLCIKRNPVSVKAVVPGKK